MMMGRIMAGAVMAATGAALLVGPGQEVVLDAAIRAPAGVGPADPNDAKKPGKTTANLGAGTAFALTEPNSRCCCYKEGITSSKVCYHWTDIDIKASLADSKATAENHKRDAGLHELPFTPDTRQKGFDAMKRLVDDRTWCPDVESARGTLGVGGSKWCPQWHTNHKTSRENQPIKATADLCKKAPKKFDVAYCIDEDKEKYQYHPEKLAARVDKPYRADPMCCCYPDVTMMSQDEYCYLMFHEDVETVQHELNLTDKDGKPIGVGNGKCPKAYWKVSAETVLKGAGSYLCPTRSRKSQVRPFLSKLLTSIFPPISIPLRILTNTFTCLKPFLAVQDVLLEPIIQKPDSAGCKDAKEWKPNRCYTR